MKKPSLIALFLSSQLLFNIYWLKAQKAVALIHSPHKISSSSLVIGPTSYWSGGSTPSCIYPSYSSDSILVTIPAGITVTDLNIDYAYVTKDTFVYSIPLSDGRFYFSTSCGQSIVLYCDSSYPGICYLVPNNDFHNPLTACYTPSCNPQSFWLSAHLSRMNGGTGCNDNYVWYSSLDTAAIFKFSAYVEGTPIVVLAKASTTDNGPCDGTAKVTASGGTPPYTYLWSPNNQTTDSIGGQCYGTYCCTVTDSKGCTDSICVVIAKASGINEITNLFSINIYPDPNTGHFVISGVKRGQIIELYNEAGQKLNAITADNSTVNFDISAEANGVYLLRIFNKDGSLFTEKKIVKGSGIH